MKKAIIDGNLDEVKRINEFNIERIKLNDPYNCFDVFDINNNLIYFYNTHLIADINSAASCGHLNIVKYFIENDITFEILLNLVSYFQYSNYFKRQVVSHVEYETLDPSVTLIYLNIF